MGLVTTFFGKVTNCCLDKIVRFPAVTAACGNSVTGMSSESTQLTLKWAIITTSSDKITTTRLESYRSLEYPRKVMDKFFL